MPAEKRNRPRKKYDRELARKYIREEVLSGKFPRKQAVAVGISRAQAEAKRSRARQLVMRWS